MSLTEAVDNKSPIGGCATDEVSYLPPDTSSMMLHCSEERKSPTQETSSFQRTTLTLKSNLGLLRQIEDGACAFPVLFHCIIQINSRERGKRKE